MPGATEEAPPPTTETETAPEPVPDSDDESGGAPAPTPEPAPDSPENDTAPPPGSPADRFEEFCNQNPGACGN